MGALDDPVLAGVQAGVARAERYDLRIEAMEELRPYAAEERLPAVLGQPVAFTRALLEREEASLRFSELFVEMLTVAVIARQAYGDAALTDSEIETYLRHSYAIFNSFRHA
jgi:hypothetical protein